MAVAAQLQEYIEEADNVGDVYTADMSIARIGVLEKAAWMLNAMLVGLEK